MPHRRVPTGFCRWIVSFSVGCWLLGLLVSPATAAGPVVPGFERFHTDAKSDAAAGGRILLGELNCTACHQPEEGLGKLITKKQAPVLDGIGSRVSVTFLRKFLTNPHAVKPGTTMPALFAGLPEAERKAKVEALVHFLASTGTFHQTFPNVAAAGQGEKLFHEVGCVACHGSQRKGVKNPAAVVPLGKPAEKYNVASLTAYLRDPLKTRPSGRMPSLNLSPQEAGAIASWFLKGVEVPANLTYKYYEGNWANVPDFSKIKPKAGGGAAGFDLRMARRKSNFGMRFEGFLHVHRGGNYTFHLGSDDGSKLFIDGKLVVVNDGVHPYTVKSGRTKLEPGAHAIIVDYTQGGGEWKLTVDYQGPAVPKQPLAGAVTATKTPPRPKALFGPDPDLAAKGRELFSSVGCASCHQLREKGKPIASRLSARPLKDLNFGRGCTAVDSAIRTIGKQLIKGTPHFGLSVRQQTAVVKAVQSKPVKRDPAAVIQHTMAVMNCYACHERGKTGGPLEELDEQFITTTKEMGREGRIPPPLDGVGDKLTDGWLKHVLANGANDRPYMLTRMPKFGSSNVGHLVEAFQVDRQLPAKQPDVNVKPLYLKAAGRKLVGDKAFSCIKCHTFGKYKATGIQSVDLQQMTTRLREDWFYRYMVKPNRYRPGTRMPTPFPGGITTVEDVLDGKPDAQLVAMWTYLKDGDKARVPSGLIQGGIELKPTTEPIIYRNFISGLSPRGIAVGYPGGFNLAFDADKMVLALLWHGAFIDAAKHWRGRGQGFQGPLGDHILSLPRDVPLATLESISTAWPKQAAKDAGYEFSGYKLDQKRQPVFLYRYNGVSIEDHPVPVSGKLDPSMKRTITLRAKDNPPTLLFLAAVSAQEIKPLKDGWYQIPDLMRVRVRNGSKEKPIIRKNDNRYELLVPVTFHKNEATLVQEIVW